MNGGSRIRPTLFQVLLSPPPYLRSGELPAWEHCSAAGSAEDWDADPDACFPVCCDPSCSSGADSAAVAAGQKAEFQDSEPAAQHLPSFCVPSSGRERELQRQVQEQGRAQVTGSLRPIPHLQPWARLECQLLARQLSFPAYVLFLRVWALAEVQLRRTPHLSGHLSALALPPLLFFLFSGEAFSVWALRVLDFWRFHWRIHPKGHTSDFRCPFSCNS